VTNHLLGVKLEAQVRGGRWAMLGSGGQSPGLAGLDRKQLD